MTRRLLNLLTAVSLMLCVAVVALWVRSYFGFDWLKLSEVDLVPPEEAVGRREAVTDTLFCWRGRFGYVRSLDFAGPGRAGSYSLTAQNNVTEFLIADMERRWNKWATPGFDRAGFRYVVHEYGYEGGMHVLVPCWSVAAVAALAPAAWAVRVARCRLKAMNILPNTCHSCGYDLRATPGRCPECGTPATTPA